MKNLMKTATLIALFSSAALADDAMPMMQEATVGDLVLTEGYARATLPNQPVAGGFVSITNNGETTDTLVAAQSAVAGVMQLHEMAMQDDTMIMREVAGGIVIAPGKTVVLEPGGLHLMFMQLNDPLIAGDNVAVTLTFQQAGDVDVTLPIRNMKMGGHGMSHDNGGAD